MAVYNMNNNLGYWITESNFVSPPDFCPYCGAEMDG